MPIGCPVFNLWEFTDECEEYRQAASGFERMWDWFWKVCKEKKYDVDKEASFQKLYELVTEGEDPNDSDVYEIIADGEMWHFIDVEMGFTSMSDVISSTLVTTGPHVPVLAHTSLGIREEDGNEWGFAELSFVNRDKIIAWVEENGMGGVNLSNLINWG